MFWYEGQQNYVVVICNSTSVEIVLIWNYSRICWKRKQIYLVEPDLLLDMENRQCPVAAIDGDPVLYRIYYLVQFLLDIEA